MAAAAGDWTLMVLLGGLGTVAHLPMTWSLRFAPSATLAPMRYCRAASPPPASPSPSPPVRTPKDDDDLVRQMVEENAIRAEISPWEQAMVAVRMGSGELLPGIDAAVQKLYGNLSRNKRARLRAIAHLADELDGFLTAPETLSLRQLLRLAPLIPRGYGDLIRATLEGTRATDPDLQWQALLPILLEAERADAVEAAAPARPGRPRRVLRLRHNLTLRREMTRRLGPALHRRRRHQLAARRGLRRGRAHLQSAAAARALPAPPAPGTTRPRVDRATRAHRAPRGRAPRTVARVRIFTSYPQASRPLCTL